MGSKADYPAFNLFSQSYVFSRLPAEHPKYEEAVVEAMFDVLDGCYGAANTWADRRRRVRAVMERPEGLSGPKRVCAPSPLAPHNIEGFFMHAGDALSKAGRLDDAVKAWGLASTAPGYGAWPYRSELEARTRDVRAHSRKARAGKQGEGMMITSHMSCSGCHQQ